MINICFHGIGAPARELEPNEEGYWISRDLYLRIIDEVQGRKDIALSFDDGNVSDIEIGLPPLLDSGIAATFFVLAARIDRPGSLSSDEIRHLSTAGMQIGSHGMNHVPWRGLTPEKEHQEFSEARAVIANVVGRDVSQAALPLGRYDRRVLGALRKRGYDRVFSSDRRRARPGAWFQPRYSVHREDTIDSIRAEILSAPRLPDSILSYAKGTMKRLR